MGRLVFSSYLVQELFENLKSHVFTEELCMCHGHVRGQLAKVGSLLPSRGSWVFNSVIRLGNKSLYKANHLADIF